MIRGTTRWTSRSRTGGVFPMPGHRGYSIHVYNDSGDFGGFGELECNAQAIGGETGRSSGVDQLVLWLCVGVDDKVKEIALHLLGIVL